MAADLFAYGPGIAGLVILGFLALTVASDAGRQYRGLDAAAVRGACAFAALFSWFAAAAVVLLAFPELLEMLP